MVVQVYSVKYPSRIFPLIPVVDIRCNLEEAGGLTVLSRQQEIVKRNRKQILKQETSFETGRNFNNKTFIVFLCNLINLVIWLFWKKGIICYIVEVLLSLLSLGKNNILDFLATPTSLQQPISTFVLKDCPPYENV